MSAAKGPRQHAEKDWRALLHRPTGEAVDLGPRAEDGYFALATFDELVLAGWLHIEQLTRHTWRLRLGDRTCTVRERKDGTVRVRWDDEPEPARGGTVPVGQEPGLKPPVGPFNYTGLRQDGLLAPPDPPTYSGPEPPDGSVVVDTSGIAWTRSDVLGRTIDQPPREWFSPSEIPITWFVLCARGPLRLVHRGGKR